MSFLCFSIGADWPHFRAGLLVARGLQRLCDLQASGRAGDARERRRAAGAVVRLWRAGSVVAPPGPGAGGDVELELAGARCARGKRDRSGRRPWAGRARTRRRRGRSRAPRAPCSAAPRRVGDRAVDATHAVAAIGMKAGEAPIAQTMGKRVAAGGACRPSTSTPNRVGTTQSRVAGRARRRRDCRA